MLDGADFAEAPGVIAAYNVLEWFFLGLLGLMTVMVGILSIVVIVRVVEPGGLRVLLLKLAGKNPPGYR